MPRTCICLFSGGLDSILALSAMVRQGVRVIAFHGRSVFHEHGDSESYQAHIRERCLSLGAADVVFRDMTDTMIAFTRAPRFGYGKHMNACIDCRIATITTGKHVMDEQKADFLVSGEVVGQRPMSQRKEAMNQVMNEVKSIGLDGLLLRPLCAKVLDPTFPEQNGWVDREALFDFHGRNRKPQMALAEAWGIVDYPIPAGGCLLTDENFSIRLRDLIANESSWDQNDIRLLRVGRHYRIAPDVKIIVSRNGDEGDALEALASPDDTCYITRDRPGALTLVRGGLSPEAERIACGLAIYYSKFRETGASTLDQWHPGQSPAAYKTTSVFPVIDPIDLRNLHIGILR